MALQGELDHWKTHGVEGHFKGDMPWIYYHRFLQEQTASIVVANLKRQFVIHPIFYRKKKLITMTPLNTERQMKMGSIFQ